MFYRYEIKNNGKEDILYLYLTMTYEFSNELGKTKHNQLLINKTKDFIKNNSIDFKGNKVYLVIDGIVVKALEIKNENDIEILKMTNEKYHNNYLVTVKMDKLIITKITLKEYLLGVLATNAIPNLEFTTLKALCVLYRTYAYSQMKEYNYIPAVNEFQIYKPISYYKFFWLSEYQSLYNKLEKAINDTECEFASFNGNYILPFIHITNNGQTKENPKYPYLESRLSLWDYASPYYLEVKDMDYQQLSDILKIDKKNLHHIEITKFENGSHIKEIKVGGQIFDGKSFRNLLGLKSTDINIIINPTFIRFITKGYGHQFGLSQFGANEIAKTGCSYTDILKYYFPKVVIKKYT